MTDESDAEGEVIVRFRLRLGGRPVAPPGVCVHHLDHIRSLPLHPVVRAGQRQVQPLAALDPDAFQSPLLLKP